MNNDLISDFLADRWADIFPDRTWTTLTPQGFHANVTAAGNTQSLDYDFGWIVDTNPPSIHNLRWAVDLVRIADIGNLDDWINQANSKHCRSGVWGIDYRVVFCGTPEDLASAPAEMAYDRYSRSLHPHNSGCRLVSMGCVLDLMPPKYTYDRVDPEDEGMLKFLNQTPTRS